MPVRLPNPLVALTRVREFRRQQRAMLHASNRFGADLASDQADVDEQLEASLLTDLLGRSVGNGGGPGSGATARAADDDVSPASAPPSGGPAAAAGARHTPLPETGPGADLPGDARYGEAGRPLNRHSPFYIGFLGALGALVAIGLWNAFGQLATTLTILLVSLFLTLALNPLVEWLVRRRVPRPASVAIVFAGLLVVFVLLGWLVIPPVVTQASDLVQQAPGYLQHLLDLPFVQNLDKDYGVIDKVQQEFNKKLLDQSFLQQVVGGLLGAGKVVASGIFQTLTVLVLTLYFLASLPRMKQALYATVPASRRLRVVSLSEEIFRRTGGYAIGQVTVAAISASCSFVMMSIVGVPYAAVLAVTAGFLGLIPMVGATLAAFLVGIVAFFHEPRDAIVVAIYYLIYQQIENYVFVPRIMQRTVSVPGAVIVVAVLAGATLLGMVGALLAIPVAAGLLLLYEEVLVPRQRHQ